MMFKKQERKEESGGAQSPHEEDLTPRVSSFTPFPLVKESEGPFLKNEKERPSLYFRPNRLPVNPESGSSSNGASAGRFPSWLHRKMPRTSLLNITEDAISSKRLHTVCEEAKCPNLLECYSKKTATFLLLGRSCTRACGFCDIEHKKQLPPPDEDEPKRVVEAAVALGLKHVVLTMVARDDLSDGGAAHIVKTVQAIRRSIPEATCEVLVSDFNGNEEAIRIVCEEAPEIFNHNLETVMRLTPKVRHTATYARSLAVLQSAKKYALEQGTEGFQVKSGIMVGLGETEEEVCAALFDLHTHGVDIVTIGQYLQASQRKLPVKEFVTMESFEKYRQYGLSIGIKAVYSAPFVRSSYNAALFVRHKNSGKSIIIEST